MSSSDVESPASDGDDGGDAAKGAAAKRAPSSVVVTKALFEARLKGVTFASWEDFLARLPEEDEPDDLGFIREGASESIVKLDPMHILAWVASFCIQLSLWGAVFLMTQINLYFGLGCTVGYGVLLWYLITHISARLAGMLWPNLPFIVAAAGALLASAVSGGTDAFSDRLFRHGVPEAALLLFFAILPQTGAALWWLRKVAEEPDRAVLVTNVFLGAWGAVMCSYVAIHTGTDDSYITVAFDSLVVGGLLSILLALRLFAAASPWASVELISWTLNVGCLALLVGLCYVLGPPFSGSTWAWIVYTLIVAAMGLMGRVMNRTGPLLLSGAGLIAIVSRLAVAAYETTGSYLAAYGVAGACGIVIILLAHSCQSGSRGQLSWLPLLPRPRRGAGEA